MNYYPASMLNLIKTLCRLPGVGEKTAERLAMHILRAPSSEAEKLSRAIIDVKEKIRLCSECFSLSEGDKCPICSNSDRDNSLLCLVEQHAEMVAIEKSGAFSGRYHVLQGVLSPIDGIGPDHIRMKELFVRIEKNNVSEVVLALSTSVEGESTASYIAERLKSYPVKITRIASGIPIGGEIKYVDQLTIKRAMETRYQI